MSSDDGSNTIKRRHIEFWSDLFVLLFTMFLLGAGMFVTGLAVGLQF